MDNNQSNILSVEEASKQARHFDGGSVSEGQAEALWECHVVEYKNINNNTDSPKVALFLFDFATSNQNPPSPNNHHHHIFNLTFLFLLSLFFIVSTQTSLFLFCFLFLLFRKLLSLYCFCPCVAFFVNYFSENIHNRAVNTKRCSSIVNVQTFQK